jgi:flagellar basal-body rod protein FlgC
MNAFTTFDISATGMNVERMRLDVAAYNLANAQTTAGPDGTAFTPLRVVARPLGAADFDALVAGHLGGATFSPMPLDVQIERMQSAPRLVYDPGHPDADARGFVAYPAVNPVSEMIQLISVTRAYEANVRALNAAKTMALKALEIGSEK